MRSPIHRTIFAALAVSASAFSAEVVSPPFVVAARGTIQEMRVPPHGQIKITDLEGKVFPETRRWPGLGSDRVRWEGLPPGVYKAVLVLEDASRS